MRSTADDLTTRARIRDAAIGLFGRDGFSRATVRAVASIAGVSPGLVIHHFGSKAGLREACDQHVLALTATQGREKADPGSTGRLIQDYLNNPDQYTEEIAYIRRSLGDESDAGDAFFDAVVNQCQDIIHTGIEAGTIRKFDDIRSIAVIIASNSLSILVLGRHLSRTLGTSAPEPNGIGPDLLRQLTLPLLEIYTHGFYSDARFLHAAREALEGNNTNNGREHAP